MNSSNEGTPESLSLSVAERIDPLCEEFEERCQAGEIPSLDEYLQRVSEADQEPRQTHFKVATIKELGR